MEPATKAAVAVDFDKIREDFPVLRGSVNSKPLVYLDNGASSQMPAVVADRLDHYHRYEHAKVHRGIHTLSQRATDAYERTRKRAQKQINSAEDHELIVTNEHTDSPTPTAY